MRKIGRRRGRRRRRKRLKNRWYSNPVLTISAFPVVAGLALALAILYIGIPALGFIMLGIHGLPIIFLVIVAIVLLTLVNGFHRQLFEMLSFFKFFFTRPESIFVLALIIIVIAMVAGTVFE